MSSNYDLRRTFATAKLYIIFKGLIMDGCVLLTSTPECVVSPRRPIMRAWLWCQDIIQTNAELLSITPLGTNSSEILMKIPNFSFSKMQLKISSVKWRPFCPRGDELRNALMLGIPAVLLVDII